MRQPSARSIRRRRGHYRRGVGRAERAGQAHGLPVTTTLMAKGAYPETDKLSLGMLGMHGTPMPTTS